MSELQSIPKTKENQKPYFWVEGGDDFDKNYFAKQEKFLQFLIDNDPCVSGCDFMTDEEWAKVPVAE